MSTDEGLKRKRATADKSSDSPYHTKKKGYPGYPAKNSSSDHKIRSRRESDAHDREAPSTFSPECHFFTMIAMMIILASATWACVSVYGLPPDPDKVSYSRVFSREIHRRVTAYISDNLDCSIYMKQLQLKSVSNNMIIMHGLACLYLNEPHSFTPDSAYSLMFHWQQSRASLAQNYARGYVDHTKTCLLHNQDSIKKQNNSHCNLRLFHILGYAEGKLNMNRIADSLQSSLFLDLKDSYKNNYQSTFTLLTRFSDTGDQQIYPTALNTSGYTVPKVDNEGKYNRMFRASPLLVKMIKQYNPLMTSWNQEVFNEAYINVTTQTTLNITKDLGRHLVHHFFYTENKRGGAMLKSRYPEGDKKEAQFYTYFLVAQREAFRLLPLTNEWKNKRSAGKWLQNHANHIVKQLVKFYDGTPYRTVSDEELLTRKNADRVSTLMTWSEEHGESFIAIINAALPKPFDSPYVSGKKHGQFAPFKSSKYGESVAFTSSASVVLLDISKNAPQYRVPKIAMTASGSIRTIEAVALPILRYLIFNESPGEAVYAPTAYVSLRDGSLRCEQNRKMKNGKKFKDSILKLMQRRYNLECDNVDEKVFEETDRAAYMIVRDGKSSSNKVHVYMKTAVDERGVNYNYATGY